MAEDGGLFSLPPELFTALGTVAGFALLGGLDYDQQNALGNLLELLGQLLLTSAAQGQLLQAQSQSEADQAFRRSLLARLDALEAELRALRGESPASGAAPS